MVLQGGAQNQSEVMPATLDKLTPVFFPDLGKGDLLIPIAIFQTIPVQSADLPILNHKFALLPMTVFEQIRKFVWKFPDNFKLACHGFFVVKQVQLALLFF